jgi:hypothetical protein
MIKFGLGSRRKTLKLIKIELAFQDVFFCRNVQSIYQNIVSDIILK